MLQNGQMTDFAKTLDQLKGKLSLELNVKDTDQYFYRKRLNWFGNIKRGSIARKFPTTFKYGSAPPPGYIR